MYNPLAFRLIAFGIVSAAAVWCQTPAASSPISVRQELLTLFEGAAKRAVGLAETVPQDKLAWRPMDGVRSFGEVFMHMAGSNFLFLSYAGIEAPSGPAKDLAAVYMKRGFELPELFRVEASVSERAQIVAAMNQSFAAARDYIRSVPEADFERQVEFFGRKVTLRGLLLSMGGHMREHLGQAIAYARVNRIVPPWSK